MGLGLGLVQGLRLVLGLRLGLSLGGPNCDTKWWEAIVLGLKKIVAAGCGFFPNKCIFAQQNQKNLIDLPAAVDVRPDPGKYFQWSPPIALGGGVALKANVRVNS